MIFKAYCIKYPSRAKNCHFGNFIATSCGKDRKIRSSKQRNANSVPTTRQDVFVPVRTTSQTSNCRQHKHQRLPATIVDATGRSTAPASTAPATTRLVPAAAEQPVPATISTAHGPGTEPGTASQAPARHVSAGAESRRQPRTIRATTAPTHAWHVRATAQHEQATDGLCGTSAARLSIHAPPVRLLAAEPALAAHAATVLLAGQSAWLRLPRGSDAPQPAEPRLPAVLAAVHTGPAHGPRPRGD